MQGYASGGLGMLFWASHFSSFFSFSFFNFYKQENGKGEIEPKTSNIRIKAFNHLSYKPLYKFPFLF